jgi:hypothetical protein
MLGSFARVHALASSLTLTHEAPPRYEVRGLFTSRCQTQDFLIAHYGFQLDQLTHSGLDGGGIAKSLRGIMSRCARRLTRGIIR